MKKYLNIVLVFCAVAILGTGCKKNIDDFTPKTPTILGKLIQHDLAGQIIDESHEPVADAEIHYGTGMAKTDENGFFIIRDAEVNNDQAYVTVDKAGFFQGSRLFVAIEGKMGYTTIQLLTKNLAGSFDASSGSAVNFEGVQLNFPQNAIVDESGSNYNGSVSVYANYIDPDSDDFLIQMPADLRAISAADQEVVLGSFGMMAVELEGSNGEKLQVKEGEEVSFEMPVPQSILASAPATIPLWHLDEVTGFWQEEGSANLEGNMYKGTVGHFSFWNCDAPFPLVYVEGSIVDVDGNPVTNMYIRVETSDGLIRGGATTTDGTFGGKMPKDKELKFTFSVRSPCANVVFEETVGPFSTDVTLPPFVVDISNVPNLIEVNITGRIVDCNGNVAPNSYIKIGTASNNYMYSPVESDGTFDYTIHLCDVNQTFNVNAFNADTRKVSQTQVSLVAGTIDLGDIVTCDNDDEYMIYDLDGTEYYIPGANTFISSDPPITFVYADLDSLININFSFENNGMTGTFDIDGNGTSRALFVNFISGVDVSDMEVILTSFGTTSGDYIEGTFGGTFLDQNNDSHTLTGSFRKQQ